MTIDVLIIGDSHTICLKEGCDALGLKSEHLWFNGAAWHSDYVRADKKHGIASRRAWVNTHIVALREKLGVENLAQTNIPVLSTVGFHVGRLVSPFGWAGHQAYEEGFEPPDGSHLASSAFVEDYVTAHRTNLFRVLRQFVRGGKITVFPAPRVTLGHNHEVFRAVISRRIREVGAVVIDPADQVGGPDGLVPKEMLAADNQHGNARYGEAAVRMALD